MPTREDDDNNDCNSSYKHNTAPLLLAWPWLYAMRAEEKERKGNRWTRERQRKLIRYRDEARTRVARSVRRMILRRGTKRFPLQKHFHRNTRGAKINHQSSRSADSACHVGRKSPHPHCQHLPRSSSAAEADLTAACGSDATTSSTSPASCLPLPTFSSAAVQVCASRRQAGASPWG